MSAYAEPGESFAASIDFDTTGLVGTVGVRILTTPGGAIASPRTTVGISESPAGSGLYVAALTAPEDTGAYRIVWDTGGLTPDYEVEDLVVRSGGVTGGSDLCTLEQVRAFLQKPELEVAQDDIIEELISRASRAVKGYTRREFAPKVDGQPRQFHYGGRGVLSLTPYDLRSLSELALDSQDGAGGTVLEAGTDFLLNPKPNPDGVYTWIEFQPSSNGTRWARRELTITGNWGWPSVPADVTHWTIVTVVQWLRLDVAAFATTFSIDEGRLERPEALPAAVRAGLAHYKAPLVA